jgi:hypothetical protein
MFGSPVVTHPVCNLEMHERIREARRDSVARAIRGRRRRRGRVRTVDVDGTVFAPAGEDVGAAFRF